MECWIEKNGNLQDKNQSGTREQREQNGKKRCDTSVSDVPALENRIGTNGTRKERIRVDQGYPVDDWPDEFDYLDDIDFEMDELIDKYERLGLIDDYMEDE